MLKSIPILFTLFLLLPPIVPHGLKGQSPSKKRIKISLFHPVSFPQWDSAQVTHFSLGLLQSKTAYQYGASINLLGSRTTQQQRGFSFASLFNLSFGVTQGAQTSLLWNGSFRDMVGLQFSSFSNMSIHNVRGVQMGGVFNFTGGDTDGVQLGGLTNVTGKTMSGLQFTPISNLTMGETRGVQVGSFNFTEQLHGMQLGGINLSGTNTESGQGVQIGLINYSSDTTTVQLGLINAKPGTRIEMLLYGGSMYYGGAAVRFKKRHSYNIIGFGAPYYKINNVYSGALIYRSGYSYAFNRFELSGDVGFAYISSKNESNEADLPDDLWSLQVRGNLEYRFSRRFAIMLTLGWARDARWFEIDEYHTKAFAEIGLVLF